MFLYYASIALTVLSNVLYHVFQKVTPGTVNPMLSLAATYATATALSLALLPFFPLQGGLAASLRGLPWPSFALAAAIFGLELGFLLAYRAGWNISLGAAVSNVVVAIVLVPVGLLAFRERLSATNVIGVAVCLIGLMLINRR
jgi:drug/metabolite transporter (DMT)-like permease